jgi:hypothetical protein
MLNFVSSSSGVPESGIELKRFALYFIVTYSRLSGHQGTNRVLFAPAAAGLQ